MWSSSFYFFLWKLNFSPIPIKFGFFFQSSFSSFSGYQCLQLGSSLNNQIFLRLYHKNVISWFSRAHSFSAMPFSPVISLLWVFSVFSYSNLPHLSSFSSSVISPKYPLHLPRKDYSLILFFYPQSISGPWCGFHPLVPPWSQYGCRGANCPNQVPHRKEEYKGQKQRLF